MQALDHKKEKNHKTLGVNELAYPNEQNKLSEQKVPKD